MSDGADAPLVLPRTIGSVLAVTHVEPVLAHHTQFSLPGLTIEKSLKILAQSVKIGLFLTLLEQTIKL